MLTKMVAGTMILAEFDRWMREDRGWSRDTRKNRMVIAGRAETWLIENTGHHLLRANAPELRAFLATYTTARTRNRVLGDLRAFFRWAITEGHRKNDPMAQVERIREPRLVPRPLTREEATRLLGAAQRAGGRMATVITLMLYGGLRRSEVVGLEWADVDFDGPTLRVFGKGSKERIIPMAPPMVAALRGWRALADGSEYVFPSTWASRGPIDVMTLWREVQRATRSAGITRRVTPHMLRHTFATEVLRRGADIRHVQALLGHATLATTQIYTQVVVDDLKPDVGRLTFETGEAPQP